MVVEQVPIDQATDAATDFAADGHATDAAEERACDGSKGGAGRPGQKADGQADTGALQRSRDTTGAASVIAVTPVSTKYVRITQTAAADTAPPWSIQQLQLLELRRR